MNNNGKQSEWSQRSAAPTTGGAPAGIQSLTRSFSMYITYVYCAIIEPRLWNIVPGTIKNNKKIVPGGIREWWAAPPGAAHRSYNPANWHYLHNTHWIYCFIVVLKDNYESNFNFIYYRMENNIKMTKFSSMESPYDVFQ